MDCAKVGRLILQLRKEKGLTQRELADKLGVSNKTVSKWERGRGAPDLSLWQGLSAALGADVLKLLEGELKVNRPDAGRMDRLRFYVCPRCRNILTSTGMAGVSCCGRRLSRLQPAEGDGAHRVTVEEIDLEAYIKVEHEMSKKHHIAFAAWVTDERVCLQRLYPEQSPAFRMPLMGRRGRLYLYCVKDGLFQYPME